MGFHIYAPAHCMGLLLNWLLLTKAIWAMWDTAGDGWHSKAQVLAVPESSQREENYSFTDINPTHKPK